MAPEPAATPPDDHQLVREAQQGAVAAFEEIVRRYQVPLLHFLRNRTGNTADAEDLLQDTLLRAYENLQRYRPTYRFSTWLFTIAHRLSLNARRKRRLPVTSEPVESLRDGRREPETVAIDEEQTERLWDLAATTLSRPKMTALWLHYVERMPIAEIAKVLNRSRVATKTMLFRARRELKKAIRAAESDATGREKGMSTHASPVTEVEMTNG